MKELTFIRHAKSDWGSEILRDVDRHLNERGYSDAYFMSEWYARNKKNPERIISSTATRALSTALIFARKMDFNMDQFILESGVYESSVQELLSIVRRQDDKLNSLMLFGHNPGFTDICNVLSNDLYFDNVPTCAIVSFHFDITSWLEVSEKKGTINFYQFPKNFKNQG